PRDDRIHDDYPRSPATPHRALDRAAVGALRERGTRFVGAVEDGDVVAVTALRLEGTRAETEFTAVDREHRRRGFAVAVKARAMLDAIEDGATRFGTGGSALNAGSLRMNSACGYVVDEHWVSLEPPAR
ncbi:GNAT family N-acetyltransferase, partial [Mesorhizobium japonicum]|uniref:GNAT family N-acetyltransferase n=1 Tax=Mesorhizobium japonicum TaxID=2066070 RepID=UPI003B5B3F8E